MSLNIVRFFNVIFNVIDGVFLGDVELLERLITRFYEVLYVEPLIPIGETGIKGLIPDHGVLISCHKYSIWYFACIQVKFTKYH